MKIVYLALLTGVLMLSVAEAGGESMSKRAQALMSNLKVKDADGRDLPGRKKEGLSEQKFKKAGKLVVVHKAGAKDAAEGFAIKLVFSDQKGKAKAFGKIKYAKSAKAAQSILFESLVMNSLPLELLFKRYQVKKDGPGDLCIVAKTFDKSKKKYVLDESQIHFVRGNVVVSVNTEEASVNVEELATIIDEKLTVEE